MNYVWGIIIDLGNVVEEVIFLGIFCMILSMYVEYFEIVIIGINWLVGENFEILVDVFDILNKGEW